MSTTHTYLPFRTVAVLGAGVMGAQIAAHLANAGLMVHLLDIPAKEGNKNAIVEGALKKMQKLKPNPLATSEASSRIRPGNFDEHLHRLTEAEWIIEAVVENMDVKQELMSKVEQIVNEDAIISTNTSGLPIHRIAQGRSPSFKKRFLGTHFFNPPRYLKLLELIPTPDTDPAVLEKIKWFGRLHLGKSVVVAKDTPNFIANRIGNYATLQVMRYFTEGDYTIEEIDTLTGPLVGHAKSATFRTLDLVGLDTMLYVADNLYKAIPDDESREAHKPPELLRKMVEQGLLGAKAGKGFYKKVGKDILSLNPQTFQYEPPRPMNLGDLKSISQIADLPERINALYQDAGRAGKFFRETTLDLLAYCARRIPEIADSPADIDHALCWGFGWEMGPFEVWDALGFERILTDMQDNNIPVPAWVEKMHRNGVTAFYREQNGGREVYLPGKRYTPLETPQDVISLTVLKKDHRRTLWQRKEAALLDLGDGVTLYEFRSKANTLSMDVVNGILEAIDFVEKGDYRGMVIGNTGKNFSAGANLAEVAQAIMEGKFDLLEQATHHFQEMILRVRYARKPVVAAVQGMVLGGACELSMHCAQVVAALETYIGLVELGAGVIPAGCGSTYMTAWAAERAASKQPSHIQPFIMKVFETIATAKVATSAIEGIELGFLTEKTRVVMNADRRLFVAKQEVIRLSEERYMPPPVRTAIPVLGKPGWAAMESAAYQMLQAGYATEYDRYLAGRLAYIMTGGELTAPATVHEEYLIGLEREVFLSLLKEKKTQERIHSIITTNKPLRN